MNELFLFWVDKLVYFYNVGFFMNYYYFFMKGIRDGGGEKNIVYFMDGFKNDIVFIIWYI